MKEEILRIDNGMLSTRDSGNIIDLTIQLYHGEIFGVLTDNTLERRLLIRILTGEEPLDFGWLYLHGKKMDPEKFALALQREAGLIDHRDQFISNLSVEENILVTGRRLLKKKSFVHLHEEIFSLFQDFPLPFSCHDHVDDLTPLQKKSVELLRAYYSGRRIMILSGIDDLFLEETTAEFFALIDKLKALGVDFILFSSHVKVLSRYASYSYRFYHGCMRHRFVKKGYQISYFGNPASIIPQRRVTAAGYAAGSYTAAVHFDYAMTEFGETLHFSLRAGEITGYVDETFSSWRTPAEVLLGDVKITSGRILLNGKPYRPRSAAAAIRRGIGIVEENSHVPERYPPGTVQNSFLTLLSLKTGVRGFSRDYAQALTDEVLSYGTFTEKELAEDVTLADPATLQKMAYCRWLVFRPELLICMRPLSSVDYLLQDMTEELIRAIADSGTTVLILTSSAAEARRLSDRVVFRDTPPQTV